MLRQNRHVGLDNEVEFVVRTHLESFTNLFKGKNFARTEILFALQLFALVGNFASLLFGFHYVELVTGLRSAVEAEQGGGH